MQIKIPLILFAYARLDHLRRTLESLKVNKVPLVHIVSDGAKNPNNKPAVKEVCIIIYKTDLVYTNYFESHAEYLGWGT